MRRISVLIPTFRRPHMLRACLQGLAVQQRAPDEVIVAVRRMDQETPRVRSALGASSLPLALVEVGPPGVVAAMDAALAQATGDIVALTDDDAVPRPDWLARIEAHLLSDQSLAGVGGRDYQPGCDDAHTIVGRVAWFGRVQGNHHLRIATARRVDVLKGVNCAFRGDLLRAVRFDNVLLGTGAQVHWELSLCLSLRRLGWRLLYDPDVVVDHYPARRFDDDQRGAFTPAALTNEIANETYVLWQHLGPGSRLAYSFWAACIGTRGAPGIAQWARARLSGDRLAGARARAALRGRIRGLGMHARRGYAAACTSRSPIVLAHKGRES